MEKALYWFNELGEQFNDVVGKKCANLGEMTKLGMRVPYGFAISVHGFEEFMEKTGLACEVKDYLGGMKDSLGQVEVCQNASREIQRMIESTAVPEGLKEGICSYYRDLSEKSGRKDVSAAVRSSGVVSMPGQMDTYLNVIGCNSIVEHVKKVWSSVYSARAITFRLKQGVQVEYAPIGVAVMMLVDAKAAGVILTVLPQTGDTTKVVIEGNWGLGESVVSGEITPDCFTVDKNKLDIIDQRVARKIGMIKQHGSGTVYQPVPENLVDAPCLQCEEIKEITKVALSVEKHFGVPQDMEWVVDASLPFPENIFWVQARPAKFSVPQKANEIDYIVDLMARMFVN
ncbi:MAG: Phosphoenolpyruvate synthase [Syntrophorhabdus sp. PtaB.Bin006]|nr:MAG: Phosphoenolpyruvate synthase [Syntrophorhabdus sp. PtaB.Bin006]